MRAYLESLKHSQSPVQGLILYLRNSSGASDSQALEIAGLFIEIGPLMQEYGVDISRSLATVETQVHYDLDPALIYAGPLVILVNKATASAGEILVLALKDYYRALILGNGSETTFGKSTAQSHQSLLGSYLKLTTHYYFSPMGTSYLGKGIPADLVLNSPPP